MVGGYTPENKPATPEVQKMVDDLVGHVNTHLGTSYTALKAHHFQTQVVAGTNYMVKVSSGNEYVHLEIFKPLPHTGQPASLTKAQGGKTMACPL